MILAFAEQRDGQLKKVAFESLLAGYRISENAKDELAAVIVGDGISTLADQVRTFGVSRVFLADSPELRDYTPEGYGSALASVVRRQKAKLVVMGATAMGKDLAATLAARLECRALQDCVSIDAAPNGSLDIVRPVFAGKALSRVTMSGPGPLVIFVRPRAVDAQQDVGSQGEVVAVELEPQSLRSKIAEIVKSVSETVELTEAGVIVSGGRGMKGPENYALIEELARTIKAAVGASRAAVDAGWRDHQDQVGQTGKVVAPTVYIACGISGAIQHLVGMSGSKCIVAINKDPEANIFKVADYGVVGDLFKIVPLLTEEFRKLHRN